MFRWSSSPSSFSSKLSWNKIDSLGNMPTWSNLTGLYVWLVYFVIPAAVYDRLTLCHVLQRSYLGGNTFTQISGFNFPPNLNLL